MKLFKSITYALSLLLCPALFCSAPAPSAKKESQAMVEKRLFKSFDELTAIAKSLSLVLHADKDTQLPAKSCVQGYVGILEYKAKLEEMEKDVSKINNIRLRENLQILLNAKFKITDDFLKKGTPAISMILSKIQNAQSASSSQQPAAPVQPAPNDDIAELKQLHNELKNGWQNIVEQSKNMETQQASMESIQEAQKANACLQISFEKYKNHCLMLKQTGRLSLIGDQEVTRIINYHQERLPELAHHMSQLIKNKNEVDNANAQRALVASALQKGNQLVTECDQLIADAHFNENFFDMALSNGSTPQATTAMLRSTITLVARTLELEGQRDIFKAQVESLCNKPTLSELQSNDSKQTEDK